jgi:uncharacterized membrane protein
MEFIKVKLKMPVFWVAALQPILILAVVRPLKSQRATLVSQWHSVNSY